MSREPRPDDIELEFIRLPTGQQVRVRDITNRTYDRKQFNLQTHKAIAIRPPPNFNHGRLKYKLEERKWQFRASLEEIQARYKVKQRAAKALKYAAGYIMEKLNLHDEWMNK